MNFFFTVNTHIIGDWLGMTMWIMYILQLINIYSTKALKTFSHAPDKFFPFSITSFARDSFFICYL